MKKVLPFINTGFCLLLTLGSKFIFHACGPKEDGSYMMCHYAERSIFALGIVITVVALAAAILRNEKLKAGLSLAIIPMAVLEMFIPNCIIPMCMMDSMRCQGVMRPVTIALSLVIVVLAALGTFFNLKKSK